MVVAVPGEIAIPSHNGWSDKRSAAAGALAKCRVRSEAEEQQVSCTPGGRGVVTREKRKCRARTCHRRR